MIVWHVCSRNKYEKYKQRGFILPPVRAWVDINEAFRFSVSTGRSIILRLKFPNNSEILEGHKGKARISRGAIKLLN